MSISVMLICHFVKKNKMNEVNKMIYRRILIHFVDYSFILGQNEKIHKMYKLNKITFLVPLLTITLNISGHIL